MLRQVWRWALRWAFRILAVLVLVVVSIRWINPPINIYQAQEWARLGALDRKWVPLEAVAPVMVRSVVAAEDANFCLHAGVDFDALSEAIAEGGKRGASTITQQTAKNVLLWHGRSFLRKGLEAGLAFVIELAWGKGRILEVYLNVAEFDEGVFGVEAGARHYFGVSAQDLSAGQAAALAVVLPAPKDRSASRPTEALRKRAARVRGGAETIARDGRAACFEPAQ